MMRPSPPSPAVFCVGITRAWEGCAAPGRSHVYFHRPSPLAQIPHWKKHSALPWMPCFCDRRRGRICSGDNTSFPPDRATAVHPPPGRRCGRGRSTPGRTQAAKHMVVRCIRCALIHGSRKLSASQKQPQCPPPCSRYKTSPGLFAMHLYPN